MSQETAHLKSSGSTVPPVVNDTIKDHDELSGNLAQKVENAYTTGSEKYLEKDAEQELANRQKKATVIATSATSTTVDKDILVASAVHDSRKVHIPNPEGTIGSVPLEKVHPEEMRFAPSRKPNQFDTSINGPGILDKMSTKDKQDMKNSINIDNIESLFPWRSIGEFHASGKGVPNSVDSNAIKAYMMENFYNDWYYNMATVLGTCVFAWLLAYLGFSWWSLGFIFLGTSSVYNTEYRRFNRNVRDDLKRITVEETLSDKVETTLWLNSFLSKFWVIYMPVLSKQVKDIVNPTLADVAPGYGIDAISLEEFTLGSKAPAIRGIKTYTKTGKNIVEMDWSFAFTPNDVSEMTPLEAKEKINPKIALGVTLGKSIVSKTMPILVEDINAAGRMHVKLEFGKTFPNIKIVSVQLLEAPLLDFALKPIGGDTLGLDVMSFLPGLKSFVKAMINSNVGPMLYAPNHFDIDVEAIMNSRANDAIGVLAVTVLSATGLKSSDFITNSVDPYVVLKTEKSLPGDDTEYRTAIKQDIKCPTWNETKYILVNSLSQSLSMVCYDFNDIRKDTLIGAIDINMNDLYQTPSIENTSSQFMIGSKARGTLNYSLNWYPVVQDIKNNIETEAKSEMEITDSEESSTASIDSGIAKITLQKVTNISPASSFTGNLSPSAKLYIDNNLIKSFRTLKRINEPSWNETFEVLVPSKSNSQLTIKIFDNRSQGEVLLCTYSSNLEDALNTLASGQEYVKGNPQGDIYLASQWKPVELSGAIVTKNLISDPLGSIKINVGKTLVATSLKGIGAIDPYFVVSLNRHTRYKSKHFSDCVDPVFNQSVNVPITTENQIIGISLYDYQSVGSDRFIGSINMAVLDIFDRDPKTKEFICKKGVLNETLKLNLKDTRNMKTKNTMEVEFSFIPTAKVYSPAELSDVQKLESELKEKKKEFENTQAEHKEEMDLNPDDWEIATINNPFEDDEAKLSKKEKLNFDELISRNSGILTLEIVKGKLSRPSTYLNVHVDDVIYPEIVSTKYRDTTMVGEVGYIFIRDLKHSKLLFRVSKKRVAKDEDDVVSELYVDTLKILSKGYVEPMKVEFSGSTIYIQALYNPSIIDLPLSETVVDTGILNLNIKSGTNLLSADKNGKSDPFVIAYINNEKVHKTKIIKKTLDPVWNETFAVTIPSRAISTLFFRVLDWDRTGDNDELGYTSLDLTKINPNETYTWECKLNTQGSIKLQGTFKPQYIRPTMDIIEKGLSSVPFKAIGTVGGAGINAASSVAGAAVGIAGVGAGGIKKGGSLLKSFGGNKLGGNSRSSTERLRTSISGKGRRSLEYNNSIPNNSYLAVQEAPSATPQSRDIANRSINETELSDYSGLSNSETPNFNTVARTSRASSFARTLAPNGIQDGSITIISAENVAKHVQIKLSLTQGGRMKNLYKTRNEKVDPSGVAVFNETCQFKASPEANLVITALSRHLLSKDKDAGVAQVLLSDPQVQVGENLSIKIGTGQIIVKVSFGTHSSSIPPVPEVPIQYTM